MIVFRVTRVYVRMRLESIRLHVAQPRFDPIPLDQGPSRYTFEELVKCSKREEDTETYATSRTGPSWTRVMLQTMNAHSLEYIHPLQDARLPADINN